MNISYICFCRICGVQGVPLKQYELRLIHIIQITTPCDIAHMFLPFLFFLAKPNQVDIVTKVINANFSPHVELASMQTIVFGHNPKHEMLFHNPQNKI